MDRLPPSNSGLMSSLQLTQLERNALRLHDEDNVNVTSSPSTPTSLLSHPDFVDPRPDIYRFAFNVTPVSQISHESPPNPSFDSRPSSRCEDVVAHGVNEISGAGPNEATMSCVGKVGTNIAEDDSHTTGDTFALVVDDSDSDRTTDKRGNTFSNIGDNGDPFFLEMPATEEQVTSDSQSDGLYYQI